MPKKNISININTLVIIALIKTTLNNAVSATLGPKGRNVVIEKSHGVYSSTKDGVSVAKEVTLDDPLQNAGVQILKEVAIVPILRQQFLYLIGSLLPLRKQ